MTMILVIPMTITTMMHICKGSSVKHKNVIRMTTTQAQIVMVKNSFNWKFNQMLQDVA